MPLYRTFTRTEWARKIADARKNVSVASTCLSKVTARESQAINPQSGIEYPIDVAMHDVIGYFPTGGASLAAFDGAFLEAIQSLQANMLACTPGSGTPFNVSGRYAYLIKPGRPVSYTNARLRVNNGVSEIIANTGTPFSQVQTVQDYVKVTLIAPGGETVQYPIETSWDDGNAVQALSSNPTGSGVILLALYNHLFNPSFDTYSLGWLFKTGWSPSVSGAITAGAATATTLEQPASVYYAPLLAGMCYHIQYDISAYTAGAIRPALKTPAGVYTYGVSESSSGVKQCAIMCSETGSNFELVPNTTFQGTIASVYVTPLLNEYLLNGTFSNPVALVVPGWTITTTAGAWSFPGGGILRGAVVWGSCIQNTYTYPTTPLASYTVKFTIANFVAGLLIVTYGATFLGRYASGSNGTFTCTFAAPPTPINPVISFVAQGCTFDLSDITMFKNESGEGDIDVQLTRESI